MKYVLKQLAANANYYEEALYFEIIQKSSISHANKNANKNEVLVSKSLIETLIINMSVTISKVV